MNKNWVTFSWSADTERFDPIREFLEKHGCSVSHRHMDGFIRGFLIASGIQTDKPAVFHNGSYIGGYDELVRYWNGNSNT
jgi:hypothetical protein